MIIRYNALKLIHCHLSMSEKQVCNKNEQYGFFFRLNFVLMFDCRGFIKATKVIQLWAGSGFLFFRLMFMTD